MSESTKREKLKTYRETEVKRIKASERMLREYFDRTFEERHETHKRLFESLDRALESGDVSAMQIVVGAGSKSHGHHRSQISAGSAT